MIFEKLDNPEYKDQKLSIIEKGIIISLAGIAKIILWKVKRAKTYGDLWKIGKYFESKMDNIEKKYENTKDNMSDEMKAATIQAEIELAKIEVEQV